MTTRALRARRRTALSPAVGLCLALAAAFARAGDPDAAPPLARWAVKTKEVRTVSASFTQSRHLKIFTEPIVSKGTLLVQIEKGMTTILWHTLDPEEGYTQITPKRVLTWIPGQKSAEEIPFGEAQEPFARLLLGPVLPATVEEDFEVVAPPRQTARSETSLTLRPRSEIARRLVSEIVLRVDEESGLVRSFTIREPAGDSIDVTLSDMKINPDLDTGALDVPVPAEVPVKHPLGKPPAKK